MQGFVVGRENEFRTIEENPDWDDLINRDDLAEYLSEQWDSSQPTNDTEALLAHGLLLARDPTLAVGRAAGVADAPRHVRGFRRRRRGVAVGVERRAPVLVQPRH